MTAVTFTPEDLAPFATIDEDKAEAMITDALAMAARVAPCIYDEDFEYSDAARAVIRRAILRWNEAGAGAVVTETAGPFGQTVEGKPSQGLFWPSEISELATLCSADSGTGGQAFEIDTLPTGAGTTYWPDTFVDDLGWVTIR